MSADAGSVAEQCPICGCPTKCDEAAYGRLYDALLDLVDTVERGDEYKLRERMVAAGRELRLERYYSRPSDGSASAS